MNKSVCIISVIIAVVFASCRTESYDPSYAELRIQLLHNCGNDPLLYDTLIYQNAAGESYQVEHLEYYISGITLYGSNGSRYYDDGIYYVNARENPQMIIHLDSIVPGTYSGMTCHIGIDSGRNDYGYLPNTMENAGMAWPEFMGGGYHFMKLEGRFQGAALWGFAVHLGSDSVLPTCSTDSQLELKYINHNATLTMDVNEWFQNPHSYSFINDGNYTMGDQLLMGKIRDNGNDIFSLQQNN